MKMMMRYLMRCLAAVLLTFLAGCNLPRPQNGQATPLTRVTLPPVEPTFTAPAATSTTAAEISLELLKNFTYAIPDFNIQAGLANGAFNNGEVWVTLVEPVGLGDLDGDGRTDAAVVLTVDPSGSGTFYHLTTVVDQNGMPVQVGYEYIGDRQGIRSVTIEGGRVVLDYVTQSVSDPLCCPSEHRLRSYVLENSELKLASEQVLDSPEAQATPLPNAILIDQPAELAIFTNPLIVSGRVSQVPPERVLAYALTDLQATLLAQGEVPLDGEPGGPGTFAFEIPLALGGPGVLKLELVDSAGGILRGRSVVELLAQ